MRERGDRRVLAARAVRGEDRPVDADRFFTRLNPWIVAVLAPAAGA